MSSLRKAHRQRSKTFTLLLLVLLGWCCCFLRLSEAAAAPESVVRSPEKGSALPTELLSKGEEQQQQEEDRQPKEDRLSEFDENNDNYNEGAPSFPGIFTAYFAHPSSTLSEHASHGTPTAASSLFGEFDVIRFDCDHDHDHENDATIGGDPTDETAATKNTHGRSCRGHLLVQDRDTYQDLRSSNISLYHELRSLHYNPTLTERWVRPKLRVVEEHAKRKLMPLSMRSNSPYSTIAGYDCYYDYQGTLDWIEDFVAQYSSSPLLEITWTDIGNSWEKTRSASSGYDIHVLTITKKAAPGGGTTPDKAPFLIASGVHAREYTPPILVRKWLEVLIAKVEAGDADMLSMLEQTEIHWIPYLNPDGRVLAETTQTMRRKNTNDQWKNSQNCAADSTGVDLNRNFPFEWGNNSGSSSRACEQTSRGPSPGSEPETEALVEYGLQIFPSAQRQSNALDDPDAGNDYNVQHSNQSVEGSSRRWKGYDPWTTVGVYIDIHSYGRVYIYPWGNQDAVCPNDAGFRSGMGHLETLTTNDPRGPGNDFFGAASGATDDWAYGVLGAFAMTWELGRAFNEPCDHFEEFAPRHYGGFEYLAKIAPFPFALGRGPILNSIEDLPQRVALEYSRTTDTAQGCAEFLRMSTDGLDTSNLEFGVNIQLPEILETNFDPINFIDDDPDHPQYREEPSRIDIIRVYHSGGHPLVGIARADQTASGRDGDYWEVDVSNQNFNPSADGGQEYRISIPKDDVWEAFGVDCSSAGSPGERTLYFQTVDNVGNPGPVTAQSLSIALAETYDCTSGDDLEGLLFRLEVRLDADSGSEFGWTLTNDLDGSGWEGRQNFAFPDNQSFRSTVCLPKNECWTLEITDADGLADDGYYKAYLAGNEVVSSSEAFVGTATHGICIGQQKDCADARAGFRYKKRKRSKKTTKTNCRKLRQENRRDTVKICSKKTGRKKVERVCAKTCGRVGEGDCQFLEGYGDVPVPTVPPGSLVLVDMD